MVEISLANRKAQIKMGETIAIMFIFFILLIVGAVFYLNMQRTTVGRDIQQAYELRAVELSQIISFMPELQCTEANVVTPSCFDIDKILALSRVAADGKPLLLYDREFGQVKIEVNVIYPVEMNITLYNNPKPDFTSAPVTHVPISLFNGSSNSRYFGVLDITVYN